MTTTKFFIVQDSYDKRYNFYLKDGKETLLTGIGSKKKDNCISAIIQVKINAPFETRYECYNGLLNYKFVIRSSNGFIVATSRKYLTSAKRDNVMNAVKRLAAFAPFEEVKEKFASSVAV